MTARINLPNEETERGSTTTASVRRMGFRDFLYTLHMFFGVAASLYFCLMSVTGVSLVFREELESLLTNQPKITPLAAYAPLSSVVSHVQSRYVGQQVSGLSYSLEADKPLLVYVLDKAGTYSPVHVNPYDASVIGAAPENFVLKFLQETHHNLLFKKTGRRVNAIGGGILFLLALSGIGLFFRGFKYCVHTLKMKWKGSAHVIAWSMHQQVGFFLLPPILLWGLSGFSFGFRPEFERALNLVLPVAALSNSKKHKDAKKHLLVTDAPLPAVSVISEDIKPKAASKATDEKPPGQVANSSLTSADSLDLLIPLSLSVCPGQQVARIATAIDDNDVAKVWMTNSHSMNKSDNTEVDISASKGTIVSISRPEKRSGGDVVLMWLPKIHFGTFGGTATRILWCVIGFAPLVLAVSGLVMWWRRGRR